MVSLIIPCYNPPAGWAESLRQSVQDCTGNWAEATELILVIDGNSPGVEAADIELLQKALPGFILVRYAVNRGKGHAIREGVKAAMGNILIYTDIDFPYTTESCREIYQALSTETCDIAIGVKDAHYYSHVPPFRRFVSRTLRAMIRVMLSMPVSDTQCGLKGFKATMAPLFLSTTIDRYLFDLEFVRNAYRSPARPRVTAIPVRLRTGIQFRSMNPRILTSELANFVRVIFKK